MTNVNDAPVLEQIEDQTIPEMEAFSFMLSLQSIEGDTLAFSLIGAPTGAGIDPVTGEFSWTPAESQGPGVYTFTVKVTDNGDPSLSDEQEVELTVLEVNRAPVLAEIDDDTIDEMVPYGFTASATDPDLPANTLAFSLIGAPTGAGIDPVTGEFSWTPAESQGPGVYTFTVKVTDNGDPSLSDEQEVELTVLEVNRAPVLAEIDDDTIDEMVPYGFTASATDPDLPANTLAFSLIGAPTGAGIDPVTGEFSWTPAESQGPGVYTFTVKVTDNGDPSLSDEQEVELTVLEVNRAPVLAEIDDDTIDEMVPYGFTASATDPDLPANTLAFSLIGAPTGAGIDPVTGEFSWTPAESQGPGVYTFTVKVTDNGDPSLSDEQEVELTVLEVNRAPVLAEIDDDTIDEMVPYGFTASATDPDLPANTLAFSLIGAPTGAGIDPVTGEFSWTPAESQGPGVYTFTVKSPTTATRA